MLLPEGIAANTQNTGVHTSSNIRKVQPALIVRVQRLGDLLVYT